jgi:preprotein translocase subunit Sss1
MSKNAKMLLDRWIFRTILVILIVTVVGFVVKLIEVI